MFKTDSDHMQHALQLAARGRLTVSPNPMVGCVIVKNGEIIGEGFHQCAGEAHAEIIALKAAGKNAQGATMYVTLEPCCHYGKTPPCTRALIAAGVKKIYVACEDPHTKVAGRGIEELRAAGITVEMGLENAAAEKLNEIFFHYQRHKRPFVVAKWAMSLDGKTITQENDCKKISSSASHQQVHQLRHQLDAILIGANTARQDNPELTVREMADIKRQPLRIVLTNSALPATLKLFNSSVKTLIFTTEKAEKNWQQPLLEKNIEIIVLPQEANGEISLTALLDELGRREITSLLVEGGMQTLEKFFQANLVNKVNVYLAPVIIGTLDKKQYVKNINFSAVGSDFNFAGEWNYV